MTDRWGLEESAPSEEHTLDYEEYEEWMEKHLNDIAERGAERKSRRARWEIDNARRDSEMTSASLNTTTEALDPGEEIEYGIESNMKMGEVDRMRMGGKLVISTHEPKGSRAIARKDETKQGADIGTTLECPDELNVLQTCFVCLQD